MDKEIARGEGPLHLLVALLRAGRLTTRGAMAVLGLEGAAGRKRARRALKRLTEVGPVVRQGAGASTRYVLDPLGNVDRLTTLDQLALRVGRDAVSFLQGTLLAEGLDKAVGEQALDTRFVHRAEPEPCYAHHQDAIDGVLDGLVRTRTLSLTYGRGHRRMDNLQPLTLVVYRRALYLLGRFADRPGKVYRLRVDRMRDVTTGSPFSYPPDWDPRAELAPWFGMVAQGEVSTVVLRFSPAVAPYVRERAWHPTAHSRSLPDGRLELTMTTGGAELLRFALEWGEHCEVVAPPALRAQVIASLEAARRLYEPAGGA